MKPLAIITIFLHIITTVLSINWNRWKENKQDKKLYIALMIGGFIWSQLQTEYLIWRIRKDTNKIVNKE
ncbi:hypothetical protein ACT8ZR_09160 [Neobacillus sp. M.A.Huq-85]